MSDYATGYKHGRNSGQQNVISQAGTWPGTQESACEIEALIATSCQGLDFTSHLKGTVGGAELCLDWSLDGSQRGKGGPTFPAGDSPETTAIAAMCIMVAPHGHG